MALVSSQGASFAGTGITFAAPTTSETFIVEDRVLYVIKIGATSTTVTVVVPGTAYGQARPDNVIASAVTSTERYYNVFTPDLADPSTGLITITFSNVTNVTAALIRV